MITRKYLILLLAVCSVSGCNSAEPEKPDLLSPMPQAQRSFNKQTEKEQRRALDKQIRSREKLLDDEQSLARAKLDLTFAKRRLIFAQQRLQRVAGGDEGGWWPSGAKRKVDKAQNAVEKAQTKVAKAEEKLNNAKAKSLQE